MRAGDGLTGGRFAHRNVRAVGSRRPVLYTAPITPSRHRDLDDAELSEQAFDRPHCTWTADLQPTLTEGQHLGWGCEDEVGGGVPAGHLGVVGAADDDADPATAQRPERVFVGDVVTQVDRCYIGGVDVECREQIQHGSALSQSIFGWSS